MSAEKPVEPQSILDVIDPNRIAAVKSPGLEFHLHGERDSIAREQWEEKKKSAAAGIKMMKFVPPGSR